MRTNNEVKPYSEACERNKIAIADALGKIFTARGEVLEVGSGTGQHAVYFAAQLPHLIWQCSDLKDRHAGINAWISEAGLENVRRPILLDVCKPDWPRQSFAYAFSANTAHIMSWEAVICMFTGLAAVLLPHARFVLYGPFNIGGQFTSEGNRAFDQALRAEDANMGIRHLEDVVDLAATTGLMLDEEMAMPANNRLLVFEKT